MQFGEADDRPLTQSPTVASMIIQHAAAFIAEENEGTIRTPRANRMTTLARRNQYEDLCLLWTRE
jgi:hypothetical protein